MHRRRHYIYPDRQTLVNAFVCDVNKFIHQAGKSDVPLNLAISGGNTPLDIFDQICKATRKEDWSNVHIYWVDERCVSVEDPESNYGNAKLGFIEHMELGKEQVHPIDGEADPEAEAQRYAKLLAKRLPVDKGVPVFDWMWLGLGDDGHTASIFPHEMELWGSDKQVVVATHPKSGQKRISLSGGVINAARRIAFLVAGKSKAPIVNQIVMKEGSYLEFPAFYVAPQTNHLEWFLDMEATSWM